MQIVWYEAISRGYARYDWLTTRYSFSFASYYDKTRMGFGALRVLNDDVIAPGSGFGRHAHDNMEIITIPLSGTLCHEDSLGNSAVIETGEIQVMSAGTGVEHAEYNPSSTEELTLLQIWICTETRDVTPQYDQKRFDPEEYHNHLCPVVGNIEEQGVLGIHQDASIRMGRFDTERSLLYVFGRSGQGAYFFVIEGVVIVAGKTLNKRDALGVWEAETVAVTVGVGAFLLVIEVPMGNDILGE